MARLYAWSLMFTCLVVVGHGATPVAQGAGRLWRDTDPQEQIRGPLVRPDLTALLKRIHGGSSCSDDVWVVLDNEGRQWCVEARKVSATEQAQLEASREAKAVALGASVVAALGYWVEDTLISRSDVKVEGVVLRSALWRLARPPDEEWRAWTWQSNPFVGSQQLQGLKVALLLLGVTDFEHSPGEWTKRGEDAIYFAGPFRRSLGYRDGILSGGAGNLKRYRDSTLVVRSEGGFLRTESKAPSLQGLSLSDAQWLAGRANNLSRMALVEAGVSAGFSPEDATAFADGFQRRVSVVLSLR